MTHILIAEDEERIAAFVAKGLRASGFETSAVTSGEDAIARVQAGGIDLLVLDLGLVDIDGFEVLRRLRAAGETVPVIVLTARSSVTDTVTGLESGADDYMAKPFRFEELLARVRLRLRAQPAAPGEASVLKHGALQLDLRTRRMKVGTQEVDLSAREFALAETFLRHPGRRAHPRAPAVRGVGLRLRPRVQRGRRVRAVPAAQGRRGALRHRPRAWGTG